jgi:uncharacterized protein YhfF
MPRTRSRLTLRITDVRVERVQDISEEDALAEGEGFEDGYPQQDFAEMWDSFNAKSGYSWESNPWVWVIEFEVIKANAKEPTDAE